MDYHLLLVGSIFVVLMVGVGSSFFSLIITGVPVVRTPLDVILEIKSRIHIEKENVIVDAGCADARALISLCKGSKAKGIGYEINGPMWFIAIFRVLFSGNFFSIKIRWKNFFRAELEDVNVVFCYLMPGSMARVAQKCSKEMNPGSRLVSYLWAVPKWEPDEVLRVGPLMDPVYIYRIGDVQTPSPDDE